MPRPAETKNTWAIARIAGRMAVQEVQGRYFRQSIGALWALISPLLMMLLYVVLFTVVFPARLGDGAMLPAVVYILSGLVPWFATAEVLNRSPVSLIGNPGLVFNPAIPLAAAPLKDVFVPLSSFVPSVLVVLGLSIYANPGDVVLILPLLAAVALIHLAVLIGLSFLLAAITPFFRDLKDIVAFLAGAGMFLAPIFYLPERLATMPQVLRTIISFNPFSHVIWAYHDTLVSGAIVHTASWAISIGFALSVLVLGPLAFSRLRDRLTEVL